VCVLKSCRELQDMKVIKYSKWLIFLDPQVATAVSLALTRAYSMQSFL